jgi:co-chaperonin GroES (HSP10)
MNNYRPFRTLLLVEKVQKETSAGGIVLPDNAGSRFIELKVLAKGPDVKEDIQLNDIVLAENMLEPIGKDKSIGLILSEYIMCVAI